MYQNCVSEQKYITKKFALKKETTKNTNIFNGKLAVGVRKSNSFKIDTSKYDDFGRVSKHIIKSHKCETGDSRISEHEKKNLEHKTIIGSEKNEAGSTEVLSESEIIKEMFGIDKFETSKNKSHSTSSLSCSNIKSRRKYRQYMNRPGGFNRPLSPIQ